ncbi:MAG TPA: hypothetical protein DHW84_01935, partial [Firmicutes bacterium]|nr:hypothetical protein [Bacillota bacterium]
MLPMLTQTASSSLKEICLRNGLMRMQRNFSRYPGTRRATIMIRQTLLRLRSPSRKRVPFIWKQMKMKPVCAKKYAKRTKSAGRNSST